MHAHGVHVHVNGLNLLHRRLQEVVLHVLLNMAIAIDSRGAS